MRSYHFVARDAQPRAHSSPPTTHTIVLPLTAKSIKPDSASAALEQDLFSVSAHAQEHVENAAELEFARAAKAELLGIGQSFQ